MVEYVSYSSSGRRASRGPRMFKFGKYSSSTTEIVHISIALVVITLTFMVLDSQRLKMLGVVNFTVLYLFSVGLGFLLHEMGHKLVAQHYGYISEFRADFTMLIFAFLMAYFAGFVFLAPGAVMILGRLSLRENGIVSVAGPVVNLSLAVIFAIVGFLFSPVSGTLFYQIIVVGIWVNSFLGIFNMLPFWVLDGKKVIKWNKKVYFLVLFSLMFFLFGSFIGLFA